MMEPDLARIVEDLPQALVDGLTVKGVGGRATLHHRHVGDLIVTSGAIVACDPECIEEDTVWPFVTRVAPGQYPLILSIAHFTNDQRVAYAILRLREQQPVRWDVATFPTEAMSDEYEGGQIPAYGVDSGIGCFMDADAARVWARRINHATSLNHEIADEMDKNGVATCSWATISLAPETPANLIAFSAGAGDGAYASYFGYDADDVVVCLVTDFALFWRES
jgi:hypothetical protein